MKKIIRLTESDLARIVKRVIKENNDANWDMIADNLKSGKAKVYHSANNTDRGFKFLNFIEGNKKFGVDLEFTANKKYMMTIEPNNKYNIGKQTKDGSGYSGWESGTWSWDGTNVKTKPKQ